MSSFKFLPPLQPSAWVISNGNLTDFARRWLTDLRDKLHFSFVSTVSFTPASVAANTTAEQSVTVTGAKAGDHVSVSPPSITAGVTLTAARASADDTVQVTFANATAGALTPASGNYVFKVTRP